MAPRQKADIPKLFELWHNEVPIAEICVQLGIGDSQLRRLIKAHKLPRRQRGGGGKTRGVDPTPEEMEQLLLETRSRWTEKEAEARYVADRGRQEWTVPTYHYDVRNNSFSLE